MSSRRHGALDVVSLAAILLVSVLLCAPLFLVGYNTGHSGGINILYSDQFIRGIYSGVWIPSWMRDANMGAGAPAYIFYQPFIFYVSAALSVFVKDVPATLSYSALIAVAGSALCMYLFARRSFGGGISLIVALVYAALPYHLVDLYERAALSELWTFLWMPLIMYFATAVPNGRRRDFAGLALSYAALVPTHLPTPLMFTPFLLAYFAFLYMCEKDVGTLIRRVLAVGTGIALSGFYLLPALMEQKYIKIGYTFMGWYDYSINFLYAGSAGDPDLLRRLDLTALLLQPVFILVLYLWQRRKEKNLMSLDALPVLFSLSGITAFFLASWLSKPVWEIIPLLQKIQFPWRFLALGSFLAAVSLGYAIEYLRREGSRPRARVSWVVLAALLVLNASLCWVQFSGFRNLPFEKARTMTTWRPNMDVPLRRLFDYGKLYAPGLEYLVMPQEFDPKWMVTSDGGSQIVTIAPFARGETAVFSEGTARVETKLWDPEKRLFHVRAETPSRLLVRTYYYPNWKAYVDGEPVEVEPHPATGMITFGIPEGEHEVRLVFETGPYRKAGLAASGLGLLVLILSLYRPTAPPRDNVGISS